MLSTKQRAGKDADARGTRPLEFLLPARINPFQILPHDLWHCDDEARYLVNVIVRKTAHRRVDRHGFTRLHSRVLRRIMTPATQAPIIRALVNGGVIEVDPHSQGVRSRGYRLTSVYLSQRHVLRPANDERLIRRWNCESSRLDSIEQKRRLPIHGLLDKCQQSVSMTDDADEIVDRLKPKSQLCQDVIIGNIRRRHYPFSLSSTMRVFNCVTGLTKPLRFALRIEGDPVTGVDIRCAQPALLALLLKNPTSCRTPPSNGCKTAETYKVGRGGVLPASLFRVAGSVCSSELACFSQLVRGEFYECLALLAGISRKDAKRRFIVDVLAKRGGYPSAVERAFAGKFPSILRAIRSINRKDHAELIRQLQRLESWLVIETIAPRLVDRLPIVTVHDAIYCREGDLPAVVDAFHETFKEIGFSMGLKEERWQAPAAQIENPPTLSPAGT